MNELDVVEKTFLTFLSLATLSPNLEFVKPSMLFMFLGTPLLFFSFAEFQILGLVLELGEKLG